MAVRSLALNLQNVCCKIHKNILVVYFKYWFLSLLRIFCVHLDLAEEVQELSSSIFAHTSTILHMLGLCTFNFLKEQEEMHSWFENWVVLSISNLKKKKGNSLHCRLDSMLNPLSNTEMDYWLSCWKKIHLSRMKPIGFGVKLLIRGNISMHKVDVDGSYQMVMEFESPCVSIWNVSFL